MRSVTSGTVCTDQIGGRTRTPLFLFCECSCILHTVRWDCMFMWDGKQGNRRSVAFLSLSTNALAFKADNSQLVWNTFVCDGTLTAGLRQDLFCMRAAWDSIHRTKNKYTCNYMYNFMCILLYIGCNKNMNYCLEYKNYKNAVFYIG